MSGVSSGLSPPATAAVAGTVKQAADIGVLADNSGGTASQTIAAITVSSPGGPPAAPVSAAIGAGIATVLNNTNIATVSSVDAGFTTLQGRIDALATAQANATLANFTAMQNAIATLAAEINDIRNKMRTAGQMA